MALGQVQGAVSPMVTGHPLALESYIGTWQPLGVLEHGKINLCATCVFEACSTWSPLERRSARDLLLWAPLYLGLDDAKKAWKASFFLPGKSDAAGPSGLMCQ